MRQAERDRTELQEAQQRAEVARRAAEEAAYLEKTEREAKVHASQVVCHRARYGHDVQLLMYDCRPKSLEPNFCYILGRKNVMGYIQGPLSDTTRIPMSAACLLYEIRYTEYSFFHSITDFNKIYYCAVIEFLTLKSAQQHQGNNGVTVVYRVGQIKQGHSFP